MKKILCLFSLFTAVRLLAANPVPYTEGVGFSFKIAGTGNASMTIYDEQGTQYLYGSASGTAVESSAGTAWLRPGKSYVLSFWGDGPSDYWMSFIAPEGYNLYVDGVAADLVPRSTGGGWFLHYYTLELRPRSASGGAWGAFSGISVGKSIAWSVGLGDLRSGRSAGSIQFREPDLSNSPATRDRLYYAAPPANIGQIVFVKDGPSSQRLRQIVTPIGFTDLVDISGGYEIRFYTWSQATWTGSIYTFTGSAWRTIKVESPAADQLKITETEGAVVRVSKLTGTGCMSAVGGALNTSGGYTTHTFSAGGTFRLAGNLSSLDYLVVGGGGGGGNSTGGTSGGGGGGDVETGTISLSGGVYTVTVGSGGSSAASGGSSSFNGVTAPGGGPGSGGAASTGGGSGGGGGPNAGGGAAGSGANVHAGGTGDNGGRNWTGGGGGGAGTGGGGIQTWPGAIDFNGGDGLTSSITGAPVKYGAGGGGGGTSSGSCGLGGAGNGGNGGWQFGNSATGIGGGGGGCGIGYNGGNGGNGIVIIRYATTSVGDFTWTLEEGDGTAVLRTTKHTSTVLTGGQRDDVVTVYTGTSSGTLVAKTKYHYATQSWGEELESVIADPTGAALTTSYVYHANSANQGNYRKVKSITAPTGGWTAYEYYDDWDKRGQLKYEFRPWLDSPSAASSASATTGHVVHYDYTSDWTGRYSRPTQREETITADGTTTTVAKTIWTHGDNTGSGEPRAYATIKSYRDASNYHSDYVEQYRADADPDWAGRPYVRIGANSAATVASISRGTFNTTSKAFAVGSTGDHWRELRIACSSNGTGADVVGIFDSQYFPTAYLVPNKSTMEVTIRIAQGYVYRTETWVWTGATNGFQLMTAEDFDYDGHGNLTQRWASTGNGALTGYTYTYGRLTSTTDPTGTETQFTYDVIGRVATSVKKGASAGAYASQGDITTSYTYDGANNVTDTVVSGGGLSLTSAAEFDLAGRPRSNTAPGSYKTSYDYNSGGKVVTTTFPSGSTKIAEVHADGQMKSLTGTAIVRQDFTYTVSPSTGTITRQVSFGSTPSLPPSSAVTSTTGDWLGRVISEVKPSPTGSGNVTRSWIYNNADQLAEQAEPGSAHTFYSYDTLGVLFRTCLDVSGNNAIDLASSDRITEYTYSLFIDGLGRATRQTTTKTYATTGSSTATTLGVKTELLSNLGSGLLSNITTTDIFGNNTYAYVAVNRTNKTVTTTTDVPDSTTDAVSVAYNGLVVSSRTSANLTTTFGFDGLGRPITYTDPRIGTTTTTYKSGTSQVSTVTDPAGFAPATYTYDTAGRVKSVKDAVNKYTYTSYTDRGEVYRQWGDTTYPVEYGYDNWGHQTTMNTYRAGTGWTADTWPTSPGAADVTQWNFDQATGLLSSKVSAYGTADAKTVSYTYTAAGQIDVRTWARGIKTLYGYDAATGERTSIQYKLSNGTTNEGTPNLSYTYDRLGSLWKVIDGTSASGSDYRVLNYNLSGTLELQSEDLSSYFGSNPRISYPRATSGIIGRPTGLKYGTTSNATAYQDVTFAYDTYGRFNSLAAASQTFTYGYATGSNLIEKVEVTGLNYKDQRTYDPTHDWIDQQKTTWGSSPVTKAQFDYVQDNLGRRTSVTKTGAMFSGYGATTAGLKTSYSYNDRSELIAETTTDLTTSPAPVDIIGRQSSFNYDNIGNRKEVTKARTTGAAGGNLSINYNSSGFETNALNQYKRRTVPGIFDVAVMSTSAVTVNTQAMTTAVGQYQFRGHPLTNSSGPVFSALTISGTTTPLDAFLPHTNEDFVYDADGNLLRDGRWVYQYDAENRLIAMFTRGAPEDTGATSADTAVWGSGLLAQKLTFAYDYLGRRVGKKSYYWKTTPSPAGWAVDDDLHFVYNGWNCIATLNAGSSNALMSSYYWGLDVSGSLQGAGGVGGLLMIHEGSNKFLPAYDGNGNLHALLTAASVTIGSTSYSAGDIVAAYEYDAFGNTLRESGAYAGNNPWRFSTKYTDIETSLVYYGLRYYSPSLGRFINKDPIEEKGGRNLYAFCSNNGINKWDHLGMADDWTTVWSWTGTPDSSWIAQPDGSIYWDTTNHVAYARRAETRGTEEDPGDTIGDGGASLYSTFNQVSEIANWNSRNDITTYLTNQSAEFEAMDVMSKSVQLRRALNGAKDTGLTVTGSVTGGGITVSDQDDTVLYSGARDQINGQWVTVTNSVGQGRAQYDPMGLMRAGDAIRRIEKNGINAKDLSEILDVGFSMPGVGAIDTQSAKSAASAAKLLEKNWVSVKDYASRLKGELYDLVKTRLRNVEQGQHGVIDKRVGNELIQRANELERQGTLPEIVDQMRTEGDRLVNKGGAISHKN